MQNKKESVWIPIKTLQKSETCKTSKLYHFLVERIIFSFLLYIIVKMVFGCYLRDPLGSFFLCLFILIYVIYLSGLEFLKIK